MDIFENHAFGVVDSDVGTYDVMESEPSNAKFIKKTFVLI